MRYYSRSYCYCDTEEDFWTRGAAFVMISEQIMDVLITVTIPQGSVGHTGSENMCIASDLMELFQRKHFDSNYGHRKTSKIHKNHEQGRKSAYVT